MFMIQILLLLAVLPVFALCFYVYKMDKNKEPFGLLLKLFFFGLIAFIPILIVELVLDGFFPTSGVDSFLILFVNVFFGVALVEEGFKWLVTKFFGYNDKNFDEIYDIIVFSVFASLGFACIENILYVFQNGFYTAIVRALLSIPGHACFGIAMGCFFAKAKVASINNNKILYGKNMYFSILIPTLMHTLYDTLIFYSTAVNSYLILLIFYALDIVMVIICAIQVHKVSKIQTNITNNVLNGSIVGDSNNHIHINTDVVKNIGNINFCLVCGNPVSGTNFCPKCGFKLK